MTMKMPETSWDKVVREFRRLCLARRQQRIDESEHLLHSELPRCISEWSRGAPGDAAGKKAQLDQMFQREQCRIDDAWVLHDLLSIRLADEIVPAICSRVSEEIRKVAGGNPGRQTPPSRGIRPVAMPMFTPRVAFDDVPAVIDLLLNEELEEAHARC